MQHPDILGRNDIHQRRRFQMPNLDKIRLKGQQVRMRQRETARPAFPIDDPVRPSSPTIPVDEEGEIRVM